MELKVNKYKLEEEAAELPELMHEATKGSAKLYKNKRELAKQLRELEAELFLKIKKNPKKYFSKLDKPPTDAAINKMVITQKPIKELESKLIIAETKFQKAQNKIKNVDTRKSAIKYMQELYIHEYYSLIKVSDDTANTSELRSAKRKVKNKNKKKRNKI